MYGTNHVAQCFDSFCERTMEKFDHNIGVSNPFFFKLPVKDVSAFREGVDFATLATRTQIAVFTKDLSKHLLVEHIATLGPRPQLLDSCEARFLNCVTRWFVPPFGMAPEGVDIESCPRHSEFLIKKFVLQTNSKGVRACERQFTHSQTFTTRFHIIPFQSMRLANLSADPIELQFASKEFARSMVEPTTADVEALKRCIRFLLKCPRCIQSFERQEIVLKQVTCCSDSNFAGCLHEFLQDLPWETSFEIYIKNTGGCQPLE